jgi:hypothetical protein
MSGIEKFALSDFKLGWIVGDFIPTLVSSKEIEVAVKFFHAGETEPTHKQLIATEITVVVNGKIRLGGSSYESGDIIRIEPGIFADFESVTDSALVCIKYPSLPSDKVLE